MPEGDTIHKLAGALGSALLGRELVEARLGGRRIESFIGDSVRAVDAVGKHLFIVVGERALRTHLGMYGSWLRSAPGRALPDQRTDPTVTLVTDECALHCVRAKEAELLDVRGQRYRAWLRRLGPDLAHADVDLAVIARRARELLPGSTPAVDMLLDQRVAAGIGNVYKCETLFLERCAPLVAVEALSDERIVRMFGRARDLLRRNLRPGPRRTRAPLPNSRARSDEDRGVWVYGRTGEPCSSCGDPIRYRRLGKFRRATYWCARCQVES